MFLFICELEYFGSVFRECQHSVQFNVNIPLSIARESRKHFPDERIDTKRAASRQVQRVWERESKNSSGKFSTFSWRRRQLFVLYGECALFHRLLLLLFCSFSLSVHCFVVCKAMPKANANAICEWRRMRETEKRIFRNVGASAFAHPLDKQLGRQVRYLWRIIVYLLLYVLRFTLIPNVGQIHHSE